jgi:serine/threonine protein kinase, bacterial
MNDNSENVWSKTLKEIVIGLFIAVVAGLIVAKFSGQGIFYPTATLTQTPPISIPTLTDTPSPSQTSTVEDTPTPKIIIVFQSVTSTPEQIKFDEVSKLSPEQFIHQYYSLINKRDYEEGWSELSDDFKKGLDSKGEGGYDTYVKYWDSIDKLVIEKTEIISQNEYEAKVYTEILYYYKKGFKTTGHTTFNLIRNYDGSSWLFN